MGHCTCDGPGVTFDPRTATITIGDVTVCGKLDAVGDFARLLQAFKLRTISENASVLDCTTAEDAGRGVRVFRCDRCGRLVREEPYLPTAAASGGR